MPNQVIFLMTFDGGVDDLTLNVPFFSLRPRKVHRYVSINLRNKGREVALNLKSVQY